MGQITFQGFLTPFEGIEAFDAAWSAMFGFGGTAQLVIGGRATSTVSRYALAEGQLATPVAATWLGDEGGPFFSEGLVADDGTAWMWSVSGGSPLAVDLAQTGKAQVLRLTSGAAESSAVLPLSDGRMVSFRDGGFDLLRPAAGGAWAPVAQVTDSAKAVAGAVSVAVDLRIGGSDYLITGSEAENGLSSFLVQGDSVTLIDTIGGKDGLWSDGISALESVSVAGDTFVLASSAQAGSLMALRVNDAGVFFVQDVVWDDRNTRFDGVTDMASFTANDRAFVLLGGSDAGLALFEVLPGGTLLHHQSVEQSAAWDIGGVTDLTAHVIGTEVQIFASGANQNGVAQLTFDLRDLGGVIRAEPGQVTFGSTRDDVMLGTSGDDWLIAQNGDDVLFAGAGQDHLEGGAGADVFVFDDAPGIDTIMDFRRGEDRIDLGGWGRVHDISALDFEQRSAGAIITWHGHQIEVLSDTGTPIRNGDWSADDFIF